MPINKIKYSIIPGESDGDAPVVQLEGDYTFKSIKRLGNGKDGFRFTFPDGTKEVIKLPDDVQGTREMIGLKATGVIQMKS